MQPTNPGALAARRANLTLSGLGLALFAAVFAYLSSAPEDFAQRLRGAVLAEVSDRARAELGSGSGGALGERVLALSDEVRRRAEAARAASALSLIHISEPTRLRRISYAVFCVKKKK